MRFWEMLIRLTYASQIAMGRGRDDIHEIVEAADIANRKREVTGVLAFDGRKILQILEGPALVVETLFARIRADDRHVGVVEINRQDIEQRIFAGWGMTTRPIADVLSLTLA